jgi:peptidoglycan/xylan/chitin deacetylase (PgdA/CDA1 family)
MSLPSAMPILTFHALDLQKSPISFPPHLFKRGLARLNANGYRTYSLEQAAEHARNGRPFPIRASAMTFDDGYQSVYEEAFPILSKFHMTATVFLAVGSGGGSVERLPSLNGRAMLSWHEIREMHRHGIAFGAHTLSHPDLSRLPPSLAEREMIESKRIIEHVLGVPVSSFAYPFGRYDAATRRIASEHFVCACSDRLGLMSHLSDPYALERVDAYYLRGERLFALLDTGLLPWYILSRQIPRNIKRAVQSRWPR